MKDDSEKGDQLEDKVEAAHRRLKALATRVRASPAQPLLFEEALEDLSITLEELDVTAEELRAQNEELAAARQEVETERRRYQELFELAPGGYLVTDPQGIIREANRAAGMLLNVSEYLLIGKPLAVFVAEADRRVFYNQLEAIDRIQDWEIHLQPRERPAFPAVVSAMAVRDARDRTTTLRWLFHDISQRLQAEAETRRRNRELAVLNTIVTEANTTSDLNSLLQLALEQIVPLVGVDGAEGHLRNDAGADELIAHFGMDASFIAASQQCLFPSGEGIPGSCVDSRAILHLPEVQTDERFLRRALAREAGYQSLLCIPLLGSHEVLGAILLYSRTRREFATYDQVLLLTIGDQLSLAIERARLIQSEQRARQIAETLRSASLALSQSLDLSVVLETLLGYLAQLVPCDSAQVFLLEDEVHLKLRAISSEEHGWDRKLIQQLVLEASAYPHFYTVIKTRQSLLIPDTQASPWEFRPRVPGVGDPSREDTRNWLGVPLIASGRVIGLYALDKAQPVFFTPEHIRLAEALAAQSAAAVQNAELFEQVRTGRERLGRELHDSLNQSLYSLGLLSEAGRRLIKTGNLLQVDECLAQLGKTAQQALKETRLLVHTWLPSPLKEDGLVGSVQRRLDMVERRAGLEANLIVEGEIKLPPAMEETLYLLTLEALNNALKHAAANRVTVWIRAANEQLELEVVDNGQGFDARQAGRRGSVGLASMRERAARLGGLFSLHTRPGEGTQIKVVCPLPDPPAESDRPDQTRPDQTRPDQTRPDQTRPDQTGKASLNRTWS